MTAFNMEMYDIRKNNVLLLGAGGAGSAVSLALTDCKVGIISVFDRSHGKAVELANRLSGVRPETHIRIPGSLNNLNTEEIDGVINATPMGMAHYPGVAINIEDLPSKTWVADVVYFPLETELLRRAKKHGCRIMNGSGMAIGQAVDAVRLFTGLEPDMERFAGIFHQLPGQNTG